MRWAWWIGGSVHVQVSLWICRLGCYGGDGRYDASKGDMRPMAIRKGWKDDYGVGGENWAGTRMCVAWILCDKG
jgi:hypothetical protein